MGCGPLEIGMVVTIIKHKGVYRYKNPGYVVSPPVGNCKTGKYNGVIGESSFRKLTPKEIRKLKLKYVEEVYCLY